MIGLLLKMSEPNNIFILLTYPCKDIKRMMSLIKIEMNVFLINLPKFSDDRFNFPKGRTQSRIKTLICQVKLNNIDNIFCTFIYYG